MADSECSALAQAPQIHLYSWANRVNCREGSGRLNPNGKEAHMALKTQEIQEDLLTSLATIKSGLSKVS